MPYSKSRMKKNTDHIVLSTVKPEMLCMHCGAKQGICYPVSLNIMLAMMKEWTKMHRPCKKRKDANAND